MSRLGISRAVLLALFLGAIGAALGRALRIPGGAFTGALFLTAIGRLLQWPVAESPRWLRSAARTVLGITVGATVTAETIREVGRAFGPVVIMVLTMIALGIAAAWAIHRLTRMPWPTALFGCAPGALANMVAAADDLGGDARVVASMHLVRLMSVTAFMPALVLALFGAGAPAAGVSLVAPTAAAPAAAASFLSAQTGRLAVLLGVGIAAGALANRFKVPAGEILAGMAVAAVLGPLWLDGAPIPASWRFFAQWIVGAGVGATITRSALRDFRPYALGGALMTVFLIVSGLLLGWALSLVTSVDLATAIMGSAPGSADNMIILAG